MHLHKRTSDSITRAIRENYCMSPKCDAMWWTFQFSHRQCFAVGDPFGQTPQALVDADLRVNPL